MDERRRYDRVPLHRGALLKNWFKKASFVALFFALAPVAALVSQTAVIGIPSVFQTITINGQKMSNAPHIAWAPWAPLTYATAGANGTIYNPTDAITLTSMNVSLATDVTGCTTYPVLGVEDLTQSTWPVTVTLTSGTFGFHVTSSANINAGDKLQAGIETAGAGCTGTSGNVWFTVEYVMQ